MAGMPAGNTPQRCKCVFHKDLGALGLPRRPLHGPHPTEAGPLPSPAFGAQSPQTQLHSGPWLSAASPKDRPPDMLGGDSGFLDPRPMAMSVCFLTLAWEPHIPGHSSKMMWGATKCTGVAGVGRVVWE